MGVVTVARMRFSKTAEYVVKLSKLAEADVTEQLIRASIKAGAGVLADAVSAAIDALPEAHGYPVVGVTRAQKEGLADGWGIPPIKKEDGCYNTKLGFDKYNSVKTPKYPNGQPNQLIARAVNSGTSFRAKNPFVDIAVRGKRNAAEKAMIASADDEFKKIWEDK